MSYIVVRGRLVVEWIDAMTAAEAMEKRTEPGKLYAQVSDPKDIEEELQKMTEE